LAYTQDQIDSLKAAVAKGVTRLKMGDEEVQFASLADMRRQIREMETEIVGATANMSVSFPKASRGL